MIVLCIHGLSMDDNKFAVINVSGRDRPGIIAEISFVLAENDINIVDIGHTVIHRMFTMFMIVDLANSKISYSELQEMLYSLRNESLNIELNRLENDLKAKCTNCPKRKNYVLSILAQDRPGLVHDIAKTLSEQGVNILKMSLVARSKLITLEMLVDPGSRNPSDLRNALREKADSLNMDMILEREDVFRREKRLVVFDMDSTIVDAEIIDEVAKRAHVENDVSLITRKAMAGEMDFKESLIRRVRLLKGLKESLLKEVFDGLKLTPGAPELVRALKSQGYKVALVSGGFTYFTDRLNEVLSFDHVYANKLVIENGVVTGEVEGDIIDAERKGEIIEELRMLYGLQKEQVVAIGDGANDRIMLANAGLGIAFNAKDALKKVSSGAVSKENMIGLLNVLKVDK